MQVAMLVIAETFTTIIPKVGQLIITHDAEAVITLARNHVDCGSQMLGVNTGRLAGWDEWRNACLQAPHISKLGAL
jgi:hypothetical protein